MWGLNGVCAVSRSLPDIAGKPLPPARGACSEQGRPEPASKLDPRAVCTLLCLGRAGHISAPGPLHLLEWKGLTQKKLLRLGPGRGRCTGGPTGSSAAPTHRQGLPSPALGPSAASHSPAHLVHGGDGAPFIPGGTVHVHFGRVVPGVGSRRRVGALMPPAPHSGPGLVPQTHQHPWVPQLHARPH